MSPDDGAAEIRAERLLPVRLAPGPAEVEPGPAAELFELRCELEQTRAREQQLERRLMQLEAELAAIYGSRFWRTTIPVRRVLARLRRLQMRRVNARPAATAGATRRKLANAKAAMVARAEADLHVFLRSSQRLSLPQSDAPRVSILVVLFNQAALSFACLNAIRSKLRIPAEVILVDNASSDATANLLDRLDGGRVIRNAENRHFLRAVNQAAALAAGEALLLLNNDACIREGSVEAAWEALAQHPDAAAVGGPIVLPDGTLQEAGSIIFADGSCAGYGRGVDPAAPEFQFVREVDYCSAAFLMVRKGVFAALGGLDSDFAPAYYEETDFCMRLRAAGKRILYDPRAVVDHMEFASSGSSAEALRLQRRHLALFLERHRFALATEHFPSGTPHLVARMRGRFRGRVLVIEDRVPFPSLGAGYPRSAQIVSELVAAGWFVTLYPLLFPDDAWGEIREQFPSAIEVMLGRGVEGLRQFLRERAGYYDAIVVSRPHNMRRFLAARGHHSPDARIIYDAEAIFAAREVAQLELAGSALSARKKRALVEPEMRLARAAETVVAVSERDADEFRKAGCADVRVLGHALTPQPTSPPHEARSDILFVGALDDDPSPNADALLWFASRVMPLLDKLIGADYRLLVAGRCGAERVARLAGTRIRLLGRVEDISPLYAGARLFVAPTRFAAGIPHKVHEAAARGLPVVARSLLAAQLGWQNGQELLTGDSPEAFAAACARAYSDPALWLRLREAGLAAVAADCDPVAFARRLEAIMQPAPRAAPDPRAFADPSAGNRLPYVGRSRPFTRWVRQFGRHLRPRAWPATARVVASGFRDRSRRDDYATWIRMHDTLETSDLAAIALHVGSLAAKPRFTLLVRAGGGISPSALRATLDMVLHQIYPAWELLLLPVEGIAQTRSVLESCAALDRRMNLLPAPNGTIAAALNAAVSSANGEFLVPIAAGDRWRPHTLYMLALECLANPKLDLIYTDDDFADAASHRRWEPNFKPDWSPELLLGPDLRCGIVAIRRSRVLSAGGYRDDSGDLADFDLLLRVADGADALEVGHIPHVLCHRSPPADEVPGELVCDLLSQHLARVGEAADVQIRDGRVRIAWRIADPPLVSVIIPTRERSGLLHRCVSGVLGGTDYPRIEVLIVDNGSVEPATHRVLSRLSSDSRVTVLSYPGPFNYAAMNNHAVAQAKGEVLALLNNDTAIRDPGWLSEMVSHALRPGVGAVGAKLYYDSGTIQHAGVVLGMTGVAGHRFRHFAKEARGPHDILARVQAVSAVTAACMVLRRSVYEEAGGLDELNLPVSYNDVDFCLRLRARGYRIVWTPHAELDHLESVSRGRDDRPENLERARSEYAYMQARWGAVLERDPFYNPNLTLAAEGCGLAFPPRTEAPWRAFL